MKFTRDFYIWGIILTTALVFLVLINPIVEKLLPSNIVLGIIYVFAMAWNGTVNNEL